jgi:hypothetical protein
MVIDFNDTMPHIDIHTQFDNFAPLAYRDIDIDMDSALWMNELNYFGQNSDVRDCCVIVLASFPN